MKAASAASMTAAAAVAAHNGFDFSVYLSVLLM